MAGMLRRPVHIDLPAVGQLCEWGFIESPEDDLPLGMKPAIAEAYERLLMSSSRESTLPYDTCYVPLVWTLGNRNVMLFAHIDTSLEGLVMVTSFELSER